MGNSTRFIGALRVVRYSDEILEQIEDVIESYPCCALRINNDGALEWNEEDKSCHESLWDGLVEIVEKVVVPKKLKLEGHMDFSSEQPCDDRWGRIYTAVNATDNTSTLVMTKEVVRDKTWWKMMRDEWQKDSVYGKGWRNQENWEVTDKLPRERCSRVVDLS